MAAANGSHAAEVPAASAPSPAAVAAAEKLAKKSDRDVRFQDDEPASAFDDKQLTIQSALVIPQSFFNAAARECNYRVESLPWPSPDSQGSKHDAHIPDGDNPDFKPADAGAEAWRLRLVSPLGTFLTGVRNKYPWIQLAGHKGNFLPGHAGTICKKGSDMERIALEVYLGLRALMDDELRPMVPLYYKEIEVTDGERFLEMQDLLGNFQNPSVMDVKMGMRTFLESEVSNTKPRMDLLKKMVALDPDEPTESEKENGITKLRYMTFRERLSSTKTLGFRIEGIKLASEKLINSFKTVKSKDEVIEVIDLFLPKAPHPLRQTVLSRIVVRLHDLRNTLERSEFFSNHEVIGSSLLFVYDSTGVAGVWMIDFGKTSKVEAPLQITHRNPWVYGNREDGYLTGLDNLISCLEIMQERL